MSEAINAENIEQILDGSACMICRLPSIPKKYPT